MNEMKDKFSHDISAYCSKCRHYTNHKVIYLKRTSSLYDYKPKWYKAYKCDECGTKKFFDVKSKDVPQKIKRFLK